MKRIRIQMETVAIDVGKVGSLKILHISDLHLTASRFWEIKALRNLGVYAPDLVVCTGDLVSYENAIEPLMFSLSSLLKFPGVFVFGSNDYFAATFKNPLGYLRQNQGQRVVGSKLPTDRLDYELTRYGWINLVNRKCNIEINGLNIEVRGTDDAHLNLDDFQNIRGKGQGDLSLGITHAPYARVLEKMKEDEVDLVFAGHTHGGQVRFPWFGGSRSITTNCDLPNERSRGLSRLNAKTLLNVSAGVGYSPFAPFRIFCPPEVSLVTLTTR